MPRPIQALIHTDALAHNLMRARRAAGDARVWAVVKANAYGHGIERAFAGLQGADGFALLDLAEAQRLRTLGWRGPILLLEGCFEARDLEHCSRLKLAHVVHHEAQIDWLAAHKTAAPHSVVLKMNSGMNRLGFAPERLRAAWLRLSGLPQVDGIALATHFANADAAAGCEAGIEAALARFEAVTHDLPGERSLCNSAALLRLADSPLRLHTPAGAVRVSADWVRPGIMLYGSAPDHPGGHSAGWDLRPALSLRAGLIAIRQLQPGDGVGYGAHYVAEQPMRIGVVACGYADGYPRHAPGGTPVLVDGVRSTLLGRVSMDMVTVDLTPAPRARVGSEVTLWGRASGGAVLPIDEVAHAAGTVGYDLMCALAPRVPVAVTTDADDFVPATRID